MGKNDNKIATAAVRAEQKAPVAPEAAGIPAVIPEIPPTPEVKEPESDIAYVKYIVAPKKAIRGSRGLKDSGSVVTVEDFGGDRELLEAHVRKGLVVIESANSR